MLETSDNPSGKECLNTCEINLVIKIGNLRGGILTDSSKKDQTERNFAIFTLETKHSEKSKPPTPQPKPINNKSKNHD